MHRGWECDLEVLYIFGAHEPVRKAKADYHKRPVNKGIQQADYKIFIHLSMKTGKMGESFCQRLVLHDVHCSETIL